MPGDGEEQGGAGKAGPRKQFILDTNVLLHDPQALFTFADNDVMVPIYVIEEIDNFKRDLSEVGRNARQVSRQLDDLRRFGHLGDGVPLEGGGTLRVAFTDRQVPQEFAHSHATDNRILSVALDARDAMPDRPVIFVTKDTNLRVRADALGLAAVNYEEEPVKDIADLYEGVRVMDVESADIDRFFRESGITAHDDAFKPNEYCLLRDLANESHTALGKHRASDGMIVPLIRSPKEGVWGIRPRNKEQAFALDLLLNDQIGLVTLVGKAGTGKTLLAIAAGLHKVIGQHRAQEVSRRHAPVDVPDKRLRARHREHAPGACHGFVRQGLHYCAHDSPSIIGLHGSGFRGALARPVDPSYSVTQITLRSVHAYMA